MNNQLCYDLQFPWANLSVINDGGCRLCEHVQELKFDSDIINLPAHYQQQHQVRDVPQNINGQLRMLWQEVNTQSVVGKINTSHFLCS